MSKLYINKKTGAKSSLINENIQIILRDGMRNNNRQANGAENNRIFTYTTGYLIENNS